jgi:hypothetical protein
MKIHIQSKKDRDEQRADVMDTETTSTGVADDADRPPSPSQIAPVHEQPKARRTITIDEPPPPNFRGSSDGSPRRMTSLEIEEDILANLEVHMKAGITCQIAVQTIAKQIEVLSLHLPKLMPETSINDFRSLMDFVENMNLIIKSTENTCTDISPALAMDPYKKVEILRRASGQPVEAPNDHTPPTQNPTSSEPNRKRPDTGKPSDPDRPQRDSIKKPNSGSFTRETHPSPLTYKKPELNGNPTIQKLKSLRDNFSTDELKESSPDDATYHRFAKIRKLITQWLTCLVKGRTEKAAETETEINTMINQASTRNDDWVLAKAYRAAGKSQIISDQRINNRPRSHTPRRNSNENNSTGNREIKRNEDRYNQNRSTSSSRSNSYERPRSSTNTYAQERARTSTHEDRPTGSHASKKHEDRYVQNRSAGYPRSNFSERFRSNTNTNERERSNERRNHSTLTSNRSNQPSLQRQSYNHRHLPNEERTVNDRHQGNSLNSVSLRDFFHL